MAPAGLQPFRSCPVGPDLPAPETVALARYFFEIENGGLHRDDTGAECRDLDEVRAIAVRTLTGIAAEEAILHDRHTIAVAVRDAAGISVLDVTLTLTAAWSRRAEA